jgi:hypothetical protein
MLEAILVPIGIHIGKTIFDHLWKSVTNAKPAAVNTNGNFTYMSTNITSANVQKNFTVSSSQNYGLVQGKIFVSDSTSNILYGDEIALIFIIDELNEDMIVFQAELSREFNICLPNGIYSFYAFLLDSNADTLYDAEIFAVGLPFLFDLNDADQLYLEKAEDIYELIENSPVEISDSGTYRIDLILIDVENVPNFPRFFSELIEGSDGQLNLTGEWELISEYDFGVAKAYVYLAQLGDELSGIMIRQDILDSGAEWITQEVISGSIKDTNIFMEGTGARGLKGESDNYMLDRWAGIIESPVQITGISEDLAGTRGQFTMQRFA